MHRIRKASGAVIIAALLVVGLGACESQEQRQKIETLTTQVGQLQEENNRFKQRVESLTKENQDLKVLLEAATKKPTPAKK